MRVTLLGPFAITFGEREPALGTVPGQTFVRALDVEPRVGVGREMACEALFPNLAPARSANALSRAIPIPEVRFPPWAKWPPSRARRPRRSG